MTAPSTPRSEVLFIGGRSGVGKSTAAEALHDLLVAADVRHAVIEGDLLDLATLSNVVEKSGAWYNYKTTRLGQGRENSKQFLFDNKDLAEEIRQAVLTSKGLIDAKKAQEALVPAGAEEDEK